MKQVVVIVIYSILVLLNQRVESRKCYLCGCEYDWETNYGTCGDADFATNCPLTEVGDKYCFMISTYDGTHETRVFESISANKLQDSHFIQAVETIALSNTVWLPTTVSSVGYGCDWDGCNNVTLANYLPESFQMKIDQTVLNTELLDGQLPAKACYSCGKCINDLTAILCKQVSCPNGICYIDEIHNYFVTAENNCTYNFFSYCESFTDPVQTPSVRMRATYYIDLPSNKQLEINEVDIRCTKDYCNSIEVVEYLKGQITTTINLHSDFRPSRANTTTTISSTTSQPTISSSSSTTRTTTVTGSPGSTTTQSTTRSTSTNSASELTRLYPLSVFYMILMFFLL